MDFLDSIDHNLSRTHLSTKSSRMRSWYLLEQYKSLERNQLDATQKLKNRSNQNKILHQELSERRVRRRLYDESGVSPSESMIDSVRSDVTSCVTDSYDNFFESFCELHQEDEMDATDRELSVDMLSQDDSQCGPYSEEEHYESVEELKEETESIKSVVLKDLKNDNKIYNTGLSCNNLADEIKEELEYVKKSIADNIKLQLENVQDNMQCIEDYKKLKNDEYPLSCVRDDESEISKDSDVWNQSVSNESSDVEHNINAVWNKLVSFAYQVIQLNHGNCYYDYSSQLLTAVLACDVIRRGVHKMCDILQPYVSPIKFASDDSENSSTRSRKPSKHLKEKIAANKCFTKTKPQAQHIHKKLTKNKGTSTSSRYSHADTYPGILTPSRRKRLHVHYNSDHNWERNNLKRDVISLPATGDATIAKEIGNDKSSSGTIWPQEFCKDISVSDFSIKRKVENPMLSVARYFDDYAKHF